MSAALLQPSREDFAALLEESFRTNEISEGSVVKGRVVAIEKDVAVIDIGSNSVRLVVYETMARSLVTIFNEKALCGLGREVHPLLRAATLPGSELVLPLIARPFRTGRSAGTGA